MVGLIIKSMRPKQWIKNLFVFAGLIFTLDAGHTFIDLLKVTGAFTLFCIISGCIYIINDILDAPQDRLHEVKSQRPIAAGALPVNTAWRVSAVLLVVALGLSFVLDRSFGFISFLYASLLTAYSIFLKDVVILDVMVIAAGFVLRAIAGAAVIQVVISSWLLICTTLIALFLGLAKRREELVGMQDEASSHRASLEHYTVPFLDQLMNITSASTIMSYALYTFFSDTGIRHPYMRLTLPFVIYGIFRYLLLTHKNAGACSPELLLVRDRPLLINFILWVTACVLIITLS
ncbi:MAG: decaprenyl-phosphate phosphoribosyltransferase [Armatimonadota bacterium]